MAIDHCDNFSIYGGNTAFMLNGVYASLGAGGVIATDPDGISAGSVWKPGVNFFYGLRYILSSAQQIVGWAQRVWLDELPPSTDLYPIIAAFLDSGGNPIAWVGVNPTGSFTLYTEAGPSFTTAGPVITAGSWWHVECKMNAGAAANEGTFEIRVEGTTVLTEATLAYSSLSIAMVEYERQVEFGSPTVQTYFKDYVIWNGSGTQNNDFLGAVLVQTLLPTADVSLNWTPTPNTDTGAEILATAPPQDGTVYLDAPNPPPAPYVGTFAHLTGDVTSVKCLMTFVRASKVDGGDGNLQTGLISSPAAAPATTLGANRPITTSQTYWRDIFELDPKTAAEWLPNAVNLAELQINRTA